MSTSIPGQRRRGALRAAASRARLGLVALALGAGACAHGAEKIIRRTTPATIEESLRSLNDPEVQAMIRRLLDKAEVREAMAELARSLSEGLVDGLADEERAARLQAISERFVERLSRALGDGLRDEITPRAHDLIAGSVRAALDEALDPRQRRRAEEAAAGITRSAIEALVTVSAAGLREDVGPALAHVIDDDLGPALERLLAERLIPAMMRSLAAEAPPLIGALARETSRQVVLGVDDALVELEVVDPAERGRILRSFGDGLDRGLKVGEILAWIFAALAVVLGLWLARALLKNRHLRQEKDRSERALAGLVRRISQRGRGEPWIDDMMAMIQETLRESAAADPLRERVQEAAASPPQGPSGAPPPAAS